MLKNKINGWLAAIGWPTLDQEWRPWQRNAVLTLVIVAAAMAYGLVVTLIGLVVAAINTNSGQGSLTFAECFFATVLLCGALPLGLAAVCFAIWRERRVQTTGGNGGNGGPSLPLVAIKEYPFWAPAVTNRQ